MHTTKTIFTEIQILLAGRKVSDLRGSDSVKLMSLRANFDAASFAEKRVAESEFFTRDAVVDDAVLTRTASIEPNSFNEADNTVRVIWSTGADVRRNGYVERLSLDPAHVSLDRLRGASVLDSHQQAGLAMC